jgi:hypothetical protein
MPAPQRLCSRALTTTAVSICLSILAATSPARADEESESRFPVALRPHARALEFEFNPRFGGLGGSATISGKYHLTTRSALRVGVLVGVSGREAVFENRFYDDTLVSAGTNRLDYDEHTIHAFTHLLRYGGLGSHFGLFGFAGPAVRRIWSSERGKTEILTNDQYHAYHAETLTWGVGAESGAGFEWFFSRRLSLGARYGISFMYLEPQTMIQETIGSGSGQAETWTRESHEHAFKIESTPAVILLSGYF